MAHIYNGLDCDFERTQKLDVLKVWYTPQFMPHASFNGIEVPAAPPWTARFQLTKMNPVKLTTSPINGLNCPTFRGYYEYPST